MNTDTANPAPACVTGQETTHQLHYDIAALAEALCEVRNYTIPRLKAIVGAASALSATGDSVMWHTMLHGRNNHYISDMHAAWIHRGARTALEDVEQVMETLRLYIGYAYAINGLAMPEDFEVFNNHASQVFERGNNFFGQAGNVFNVKTKRQEGKGGRRHA